MTGNTTFHAVVMQGEDEIEITLMEAESGVRELQRRHERGECDKLLWNNGWLYLHLYFPQGAPQKSDTQSYLVGLVIANIKSHSWGGFKNRTPHEHAHLRHALEALEDKQS